MLKIGITGGIGTGKTFVCKIFKTLGVPIYDADSAAKHLVESDDRIKASIIEHFGSDSYTADGKYNRSYIKEIVFKNSSAKALLESIIHPPVFKDSNNWFEKVDAKGFQYAIKEAGILYESNSYLDLDKIIVVDAPLEIRMKRIMNRDHISEDEALIKINIQWPQEEKVKRGDYIIQNDGLHTVIPQVYALHHILLALSAVHL